MKPKITIITIAHNEEQYIDKSIQSILNQNFKNFELIVVDDHSTDKTFDKIVSINDKRLIVIRNEAQLGPVESRNRGIKQSKGEYIFFTDGDCYPHPDWLSEGLKAFRKFKCVGVEGKIIMNAETGAISEKIVRNITGGEYMTGNVAYRKDILDRIGGFNEEFADYYEDREIALRVLSYGKIIFNKDMIVEHQLKKWNISGFMLNARKVKGIILLYKRYRWSHYIWLRIIKPRELWLAFFPPFMLVPIFQGRVRSFFDLLFLPLFYIRSIYMRLIIWKTAFKERVFLV
ncbi:glycosyltransferase family 2 protein [Candidatus Woesearchaeota archaeon]|nr:glycosyltransferase family 2 protein [Candidatus Woesearchaeota archaeon]